MYSRRNSAIELLKILGMILIVLFHCFMTVGMTKNIFYPILENGIRYTDLPEGVTKHLLYTTGYFGACGNLLFIVCTAWFQCDTDHTSFKKMISIIITAWILSVLHIFVIHSLYPSIEISQKYYRIAFFPLSYENNWFITCYLLLYLIHAALNLIIRNISRYYFFLVTSILFIIYFIISIFSKTNFFYSTRLVQFMSIYMIVAYVKKYTSTNKKAIEMIIVGVLGQLLLNVSDYLGFSWVIRTDGIPFWAKITNPFLLLMTMGIVILASRKQFVSNAINYVSGLSLLFYLIHENKSFRDIVRPLIWNDICQKMQDTPLLVRFIVFSLIVLVYGFAFSVVINELIMPWIGKLSDFLSIELKAAWDGIYQKTLK